MNLKRQLLLVSMLTLMLPWAGCQFIRQTESALRSGQQNLLASTARAHASNLSRYAEEFLPLLQDRPASDSLFLHSLSRQPTIDGYYDDWTLGTESLRTLRGTDGHVHFAAATFANDVFIFIEVADRNVVFATAGSSQPAEGRRHADRVDLISNNPPYRSETFEFSAEAPGAIVSARREGSANAEAEPSIDARWQDVPGGYRVEARLPKGLLGTHLGLLVSNTDDASRQGTVSKSFSGSSPAQAIGHSPELLTIATGLLDTQTDTRLLVTNAAGWRIATAGHLSAADSSTADGRAWSQRIYGLLVESGTEASFAAPDPHGRERQPYVQDALSGNESASWFRSDEDGRAIVAVAAPIVSGSDVIGALILQQGTDAILSLTNQGLARLIELTLIATILVAGSLLGYATWLSRRIRRLSVAAENALDNDELHTDLPSSLAGDEIGDLSRSFSHVLRQLGDYNAYLRSLASKLSHELRTPLAIVTSSLENLEHEPLNATASGYTRRAREGADRLRRILSAMSEASRVEELMQGSESEPFDLAAITASTAIAYRDVYPRRKIDFRTTLPNAPSSGSPELLIQMLDKLVSNAVDFSGEDDLIVIDLSQSGESFLLSVTNPGPPLPDNMRSQIFDSMVSVRTGSESDHLGLGLYVARLIAEGHGGKIGAGNVDGGVVFTVHLPCQDSR